MYSIRQFSVLSVAISSEPLDIRQKLLHGIIYRSLVFQRYQNTWPWLTLNGHSTLNSVFAPVYLELCHVAFGDNWVKTNKDTADALLCHLISQAGYDCGITRFLVFIHVRDRLLVNHELKQSLTQLSEFRVIYKSFWSSFKTINVQNCSLYRC